MAKRPRGGSLGPVKDQIKNILGQEYQDMLNRPDTTNPANILQSANYRFASDSEKAVWNAAGTGEISKGGWNASTNTPTLTSTPLALGSTYDVTVAGSQNILGTGQAEPFDIGDKIKSNGTNWVKIPLSAKNTDNRLSPNLIWNANLTPENVLIGSSFNTVSKPAIFAQTGTPTIELVRNYQAFTYAWKLTLPAGSRVNFYSQIISASAQGIVAGDKVNLGMFLYYPVGATFSQLVLNVKENGTSNSVATTLEQITLGNNWVYLRTASPATVPAYSNFEAGMYIQNGGASQIVVYVAGMAMVKTPTPLAPALYLGPETIPDLSGLNGTTNLDPRSSPNLITSANLTPENISIGSYAASATKPSIHQQAGTVSFAVQRNYQSFPYALQLTLSAGGGRANFFSQVIDINAYGLAAGNKVSLGCFLYIPAGATLTPTFGIRQKTSGATLTGTTEQITLGNGWVYLRTTTALTVPAITDGLLEAILYITNNNASQITVYLAGIAMVKSAAPLAPVLYMGAETLPDLSGIVSSVSGKISTDDAAAMLNQLVSNPVRDASFQGHTLGTTSFVFPWSAAAGGANRYQADYQVVTDLSPVSNRALKITHNKRSSDSLSSDFQARNLVVIPDHLTGQTKMAVLAWLKRDSTDVSISNCYLYFFSDVAGTVQIGTFNLSGVYTEPALNSWFRIKFSDITVPAGTKSVIVALRTQYSGTATVTDTNVYAYITGLAVNFANTFNTLPFNFEEKANSIATGVFQQLIAGYGGGSVNKRTLSYGNRMRKTLAKLLCMSIDGQARAQNKQDDAVRICHLGDSIVAQDWLRNYGIPGVTGTSDGRDFVGLEKKYPFANFSITNCGVGGQAAQHFKKHLWHQVIPYDPHLIIISTWGNDGMSGWTTSTEQFYSSYEEILRYLRKHTTADIAICSYSLAAVADRTYDQVAGSPGHKILFELSQKYDCEFIDIARHMRDFGAKQTVPFYSNSSDYTEWATRGYFNLNDVHPLGTGLSVMAQGVLDHFPDVNTLLTDFDWNGSLTHWARKSPVVQAESYFEYLDSQVRLSSESAFNLLAAIGEDDSMDSRDLLASVNSTADSEYIEFDFEGVAVDLVFQQKTDGAAANILIDGVAPSSLSCAAVWYPTADTANVYTAGSKREAQIRYLPGRWKVTEDLTFTMTGTAGQVSTTFNLTGSVSGTLLTGISNAIATKLTLPDGSFLWIRPENWYGRTANIYTGDKFYVRVRNHQAIPLFSMNTWSDGRPFPLIDAPASLDDEYMLRFYMTSATAFRVDRVRRQDRTGEADTMNVVSTLGTGTLSDAGWSAQGFSITQVELQRLAAIPISSGSKYYYFVHRKFTDTVTCLNTGTQYKRVRLASFLENKKHTVRITKSGTGKLYIDAIRPIRPDLV